MILASDETRDAVAEALGAILGWMFGSGLGVLATIVGLGLLALVVLQLGGKEKLCWRCKGKGYRKALLGGVNTCGTCGGKGIRRRAMR